MLKQRIATGLLLATAVTALTAGSAFAAEPPAAEKHSSAVAYALAAAVESVPAKAVELEADADGGRSFEMENGIRVYFAEESDADASITFKGSIESELKTDENGERYIELEDGERAYVVADVGA